MWNIFNNNIKDITTIAIDNAFGFLLTLNIFHTFS